MLFTGLSAAGKTTLALHVATALEPLTRQPVRVLDGDAMRREISPDLGYTHDDRHAHVQRVAALAAEIAGAGGVALCALIAPYSETREAARRLVAPQGDFVLVHVSTPLEACEARDPHKLYARARRGEIVHFTGVSDPYEPPVDADVTIDTTDVTPEAAARVVIEELTRRGLLDD